MTISKKFIWGVLIIFAILMIVLAFGEIDFNFSKSIVNVNSGWAEFFNLFGEQPAFWALFAGVIILYGARNREVKRKNVLGTVIAVPFLIIASFQITFMPVHYLFEHTEESVSLVWWMIVAIATILLFAGAMILATKVKAEKFRKIKKFGLILVILVVSEIILANVLKIVWARPRMRSIDSIDQFKYWFQINGLSNDNELKSFPSGHTANGFVVIAYIMFFNTAKLIKKNLYLIFAAVWGVLVAISRVVRGDHFLSDVLMSCLLTFLLFLLIQKLVLKRKVIEDE
ncbi:MAG: phosphatase PAP2 family protein [Clostridiales bacterium]|nr:phosphatase PAP2 family protein [Clostridiales bacterium]